MGYCRTMQTQTIKEIEKIGNDAQRQNEREFKINKQNINFRLSGRNKYYYAYQCALFTRNILEHGFGHITKEMIKKDGVCFNEYSINNLSSGGSNSINSGFTLHDKVFTSQGITFGSPDRSLCSTNNVGHSSIGSDGSADSIIFTNYTGASDTTVSFWAFPTSTAGNDVYVLSAYDGGNVNWSVLRDGDEWKFVGNNSAQQDASASVDLEVWQHIAIVFSVSSSKVLFYKNGVKTAESASINAGGSIGAFTLPGYSTNGTTAAGNVFSGHVSGIKFHNSTLVADEIYALANSAYDVDATSDFTIGSGEQYLSSANLVLDILGGTGSYCITEEFGDGTSHDVGSLLNYSLEIVADSGGVSPAYPENGLFYINNFPS